MATDSPVLLLGAARHSTSLIADVLNYDGRYRLLAEPFRLRGESGMFSFARWRYLAAGSQQPELLTLAAGILNDTGILVQELRAHLWLAWLRAKFPDLRIILLLRHPCAIVSTRVMLEWRTYLPQILAQPDLLADYLSPFKADIEAAQGAVERNAFLWCIQHYVPLQQFRDREFHIAFFEDFFRQPALETERAFAFLARPFDDHAQAETDRRLRQSSIEESVLGAWRKHLSSREVGDCLRIVRLFGLDMLYDESPWPIGGGEKASKAGGIRLPEDFHPKRRV